MSVETLFKIILKIFGLFFLRDIVQNVIYLVANVTQLIKGVASAGDSFPLLILIITIIIYAVIANALLFKTGTIFDKLKLKEGFANKELSMNVTSTFVLNIAIIVVGGLMLVDEVPNFFRNLFGLLQIRQISHGMSKLDYSYVIISAVKIVIAALLIGERKRIISFIERRHTDS